MLADQLIDGLAQGGPLLAADRLVQDSDLEDLAHRTDPEAWGLGGRQGTRFRAMTSQPGLGPNGDTDNGAA
ncbi:hypothetical protein AB0O22_26255 [Streptomyces sp. NPDC091204]|uniref:hypothetical protein n=1 Tax=Streptomyces sp. NPDC091204 TaxID=3155299 RepID=UPI003427D467